MKLDPNDPTRRGVVEKCGGCENKVNFTLPKSPIIIQLGCNAYLYPEAKWRVGDCPMATHLEKEETKKPGKIRWGQQKQVKIRKK